MQHAAIPTIYKGVQMRSRLEARWAAFFDLTGKPWEYEPVDLNGWIPDFQWKTAETWETIPLFEVKPIRLIDCPDGPPADVVSKIERALSGSTRYDVFILGLDPSTMWRREWDGRPWSTVAPNNWQPAWTAAGNAVQWKRPAA